LRRRIKRATSSLSGATYFVTRLAKRRDHWQREAARRRAIYEVAYRAARAELAGEESLSEVAPASELAHFPTPSTRKPHNH